MKWIRSLLGLGVVVLCACQVQATVPQKPAKIAFVSNRSGNFEIYQQELNGHSPTRLTNSPGNKLRPAWSKPNQTVAYLADRAEGGLGLYSLKLKQHTPLLLSAALRVKSRPLSWSPTGAWVGFTAGEANLEAYLADPTGQRLINLSQHPAEDTFAGWSPDGEYALFVSEREQRLLIYRVKPEGGEPILLTNPAFDSSDAAWSPDGEHLAFTSKRSNNGSNGSLEIYSVNTHNGTIRPLTMATGFSGYPRWSSDNRSIAFLSNRDGNADLYLMNADGSQQTNLTRSPQFNEAVQGDFSWSPDGQQILFHSLHEGNSEIYTIRVKDGTVTNLTLNSAIDQHPIWIR